MDRDSDLMFVAATVLGWVGVGAYGIWEMTGEEAGDGWEWPYLLFVASLFVALAATIAAAWNHRPTQRPVLRKIGAAVAAITVASSLVAWALPLWATLLAISCILLALAAPRHRRPGLAVLAAAPIIGMAAMFAAIEGELGRQNSYGDYPVAFGLGNITIAAGSIIGMIVLTRRGHASRPARPIFSGRDAQMTV